MRELNACKAEVFRRSEKRIKERKRKRRRVIACCVPFCLCLAVLSVIYLPGVLMPKVKNESAGFGEESIGGLDGDTCAFIQVEVERTGTPHGYCIKETDVRKVARIFHIIKSSFAAEDGNDMEWEEYESPEETQKEEQYLQDGTITRISDFAITFTSADSTQVTYTLEGDQMTNASTGQEITLTAEQHAELLRALDLKDGWEEVIK